MSDYFNYWLDYAITYEPIIIANIKFIYTFLVANSKSVAKFKIWQSRANSHVYPYLDAFYTTSYSFG